MRRPRVRFTVGTLLFAVALIAANCWSLRSSYDALNYRMGKVGYSLIPAGVGIVPLLNVALIGSARFMARRYRTWICGVEPNGPLRLSAITFFSLGLLGLGGIAWMFMADTFGFVEEILDTAMQGVALGWAALFGDPERKVSWVIFGTVCLGILISGPPLLLAWIGQMLANRYAAKVSPRRFRVMTGLISLGFAGVAVAIYVAPQSFWEETNIALDFQILDEVSGRPVAQAFVRMSDPFDDEVAPLPSGFTDRNGRVRLTSHFVSYGERNAFWTMGEFSPWGRWLEVSAPGHRTCRMSLTEVLGPFVGLARPDPGKVALARGGATEPFRDLSGMYANDANGTGGRWMKIEPDGRFALCNSTCVSSESQEYGYVERTGEGIRLALFPYPGREDWPEEYLRYRVVEWGDRRYLVSTAPEELREFCRDALTSSLSRKPLSMYNALVLDSDRETPLTGLPRLPLAVWATFLADEVRLDNKESTLRLALERLNLWKR